MKNTGFEVKIICHTDALTANSPEDIRMRIASTLEDMNFPPLQEEVDFTLEVRRTWIHPPVGVCRIDPMDGDIHRFHRGAHERRYNCREWQELTELSKESL